MRKRMFTIILALCFCLTACGGAAAEGTAAGETPELLIDSVSGASDEELEAARQAILTEQRARIRPYVRLDQEELRIPKGTGIQLTASVEDLPEDLTCGQFAWESSDENTAAVSKNGQVKAVGKGEAEICCTAVLSDETELSAVCKVTVYVPASKVSAENRELKITRGQSEKIVPVFSPEDTTDPSVSYESSDSSVAAVSEDGIRTAVSVGKFTVTITAKDGSGKNCVLKGAVLQDVETIELNSTELSIPVGKKAAVKATLLPGDAANRKLIWSSDDESIASVDAKGQITAAAKGTTTIHAESADGNGAKAECRINVVDPVQSVTLSEKKLELIASIDRQLTAEVLPAEATNRTIRWSSSNEAVAKVDQTGLVSPVGRGNCVITAETVDGSGVKAQAAVAVREYDILISSHEPVTVTYESFDLNMGMFTMNWSTRNNRVKIGGDMGKLTLTPLSEGEDIVTVDEFEYFSGGRIHKSWTVYVLPEAVN